MKAGRIIIGVLLLFGLVINLMEITRIYLLTRSFKNYAHNEIEYTRQSTLDAKTRFKNTISLLSKKERNSKLESLGLPGEIFRKKIQFHKEKLKEADRQFFEKDAIKLLDREDQPFMIKKEIATLEKDLEAQRFLEFCYNYLGDNDCSFLFNRFEIIKSIPEDSIYIGFDHLLGSAEENIKLAVSGEEPVTWKDNYNFTIKKKKSLNLNFSILRLSHNGLKIDAIPLRKKNTDY